MVSADGVVWAIPAGGYVVEPHTEAGGAPLRGCGRSASPSYFPTGEPFVSKVPKPVCTREAAGGTGLPATERPPGTAFASQHVP